MMEKVFDPIHSRVTAREQRQWRQIQGLDANIKTWITETDSMLNEL